MPRRSAVSSFAPALLGLAIAAVLAPAHAASPAEPAADDTADELDRVVVTGFKREYRTRRADSALGLSADVLATPLSVVSIPSDLLKDQQVRNEVGS